MAITFLPGSDAALLAWSLNFKNMITAAPTSYGLTAGLATAYGTLHNNYATAYALAIDPSTRTKGAVDAKNEARTALKNDARLLANLVNGTASVTNQQKIDLGLNVRAQPSPIPVPATYPVLEVVSVNAWTVKLRMKATSAARRGKPSGVYGAAVFSYIGTSAPTDIAQWKFEGNTGRTTVDVVFDNSNTPGTKVWLTAFWFNNRKQSGPACPPVATFLQGGSVSLAMKKAA